MSTTDHQQQAPQPDHTDMPIDPGHVMPREKYEDLVRKAAGQK